MSDATDRKAREGIGLLELKVPKLLGYIFREQYTSDYGIDADIEVTDDASGVPTGRLIAAQVKSGASYFSEHNEHAFIYRGDLRHLEYWQKHSLPVVIILVDVDQETAYWTVVGTAAVVTGKGWKIEVPKTQRLDASAKGKLRALANQLADEAAQRAQCEYDAIREEYLEGFRRAAFEKLDRLVTQPSWRFAGNVLRGEAYRSLGQWSFLQKKDFDVTEEYLRLAKTADPNSDESVVRATTAFLTRGGPYAALPLLENPSNTSAANMQVLLLLLLGRIKDAQAALAARPSSAPRNTETTRLDSLLALMSGDVTTAREKIDAAVAEKPRRAGMRETKAIVDYFSALPTSEWPKAVPLLPLPVPLELIRQEHESLQRLRRAAATFRDLAAVAEDENEKQRLRLWHLAALANDPDASNEVRTLADVWFAEPALYGPLVPWLTSRRLITDPGTVVERLLTELRSPVAPATTIDPHLLHIGLEALVAGNRLTDAREILDRNASMLDAEDPDVRQTFLALIHAEEGDLEGAEQAAQSITNASARAHAEAALAKRRSPSASDWRVVAEERYRLFKETGNVAALVHSTNLHGANGDMEFVLARAGDLLAAVPNLVTIHMICDAAWRTSRYHECLRWLDRWRSVSPLTNEALEQLRVECLILLEPLQAIAASTKLLEDYPSPANTVMAMRAYHRIGDLKALSLAARRLLPGVGVDSGALLTAAQMTLVDDPELARALWKAAMAQEIADEFVGTAMSLAYQLGEDRQTAHLIERMQRLAAEKRGGVQAVSLSELLEHVASRSKHAAEVMTKFYAAELPVHGVARALGWTLAEVFHLWPQENREEPASVRRRPLLVRFGELPPPVGDLSGRALKMDITAFLLAADLEIMDVVESIYAPIRVSRFLAAALVEQQRRLGHVQPSRIEAYERLIALADRGRVSALRLSVGASDHPAAATGDSELNAFLASAGDDAVFVAYSVPVTDHELRPLHLAQDVARRLRSLPDILAAAKRAAVIDDAAYDAAMVGQAPAEGEALAHGLPPTMVLSGAAAMAVAGGDALGQLAAAARVHLLHGTLDEARTSTAWERCRKDMSEWIDRLRERLRAGLEGRVYLTTGEADIDIEDARDLDFESLRDLLTASSDSGDATWVEDRWSSRIGPGVVGISDLLLDLRRRGSITDARYLEVLHKLRAGDFRYLPLLEDELPRHLAAARFREIPDTKELRAISRWLAACAVDGNRGNGRSGAPLELRVMLGASMATAAAIPQIWALHRDDHERAMRHTAWFMTHVYTSLIAVHGCLRAEGASPNLLDTLAMDLAQLYSGGFSLPLADGKRGTAAAYIDWVTNRYARRIFFTSPEVVTHVGRHLAELAADVEKQLSVGVSARLVAHALSEVYLVLPEEVQRAWAAADPSFSDRHGIVIQEEIRGGGSALPSPPFWAAIERLVNGTSESDDAAMRVRLSEDQSVFVVQYEGATHRVDDPLLVRFALGDASKCGEWGADNPAFFDMPLEKRRSEGERIGRLATVRERVLAANSTRARSGQHFYSGLLDQLREGGGLTEGAFQLPAAALGDHLRLTADAELSARELLREVGLEETLCRLITLPRRIPTSVIAALAAEADAAEILTRLAESAASPLSIMHSAAMALRVAEPVPNGADVGALLARRALDPTASEDLYHAFHRVFWVVNSWMSYDPTASALSPTKRLLLAMSHAGRLLDVIGAEQIATAHRFFSRISAVAREFLSRDPEFFDHALYPSNLSYGSFVVGGLCSLLRDVPQSILQAAGIPAVVEDALARLQQSKSAAGILIDRSLLHDAKDTILEEDARDAIAGVGAVPVFKISTTVELRQTVSTALLTAPGNIGGGWWTTLRAIVGHHRVYEEEIVRLNQITDALEDGALRRDLKDEAILMILTVLAGQVAALQDPSLREKVSRIALGVVEEFGTGSRDAAILQNADAGSAFLEVALGLSARHREPAMSAREFANYVDDLVRRWPALGSYMGSRLADTVWVVPADQAVALWRVLLRARENSLEG